MSSKEFSRICKDLCNINETVDIGVSQNCIKFYVDNEAIVGGFTLNNNDSEKLDLQLKTETNNNINLEFFLKYLNAFTKLSSTSQQVNLYLSKTFPFIAQYKLGNLGEIKFYLNPINKEDKT